MVAAALALGAAIEAAAAGGAGRGVARRYRLGPRLLAGFAALHVVMLGFDLAQVPWRRRTLLPAVVCLTLALWALARRRAPPPAGGPPPEPAGRFGWGDGVAAAAVLLYAALSAKGTVVTPDFVYHWGTKAHRFLLAGGVDWAWLASPLGFTDTPDYPHLLPDLYAAVGLVAGRFDRAAILLLSPLFYALLLLAARETWERLGVPPPVRQAGLAVVALVLAMFGTGYWLAGSGEWPLALAATVALPGLVGAGSRPGTRRPHDELRIGAAAAFAAGAKQEGMVLAAVLVGVHLLVRRRELAALRPAALAAALARLAGPALVVVGLYLGPGWSHGVLTGTHVGGVPQPERLGELAGLLAGSLRVLEWHGMAWLLAATPLLLIPTSTRPAALVAGAQGASYLAVYLGSFQMEAHVALSAPRLAFHLLPVVLVALVTLAGERWRRGPGAVRPPLAAALAVLLAWSAWGWAAEAHRNVARALSEEGEGIVPRWRFGDRPQREFAGFLASAGRVIEPGRIVVLAAPEGYGHDRFYLTLWAAYLLPRNPVLELTHPQAGTVGEVLVAYQLTIENPRLTRLAVFPQGVVYRVAPPAAPRHSQEAIAAPAAR
jgi:hypothetical protein